MGMEVVGFTRVHVSREGGLYELSAQGRSCQRVEKKVRHSEFHSDKKPPRPYSWDKKLAGPLAPVADPPPAPT